MKKKRCKTIQNDDQCNRELDFIFRRAYEEKLLPDLVTQTSANSPSFQKQILHNIRDFRTHSLSLTKPIKFTQEDFVDPVERFKNNLESFLKGTSPVDYFENVPTGKDRFEPQIIFEKSEEESKLSKFKDLVLTDRRQVVFNRKLDDLFIAHKVQDAISPLKQKKVPINNTNQEYNIHEILEDFEFYQTDSFNITQHGSEFFQCQPLNKHKVRSNTNSPQTQRTLKLNFGQNGNLSFNERKQNSKNLLDQQNSSRVRYQQNLFNPYQPEQETETLYNFIPSSRKLVTEQNESAGNLVKGNKSNINRQLQPINLKESFKKLTLQQSQSKNSDQDIKLKQYHPKSLQQSPKYSLNQSPIQSEKQSPRHSQYQSSTQSAQQSPKYNIQFSPLQKQKSSRQQSQKQSQQLQLPQQQSEQEKQFQSFQQSLQKSLKHLKEEQKLDTINTNHRQQLQEQQKQSKSVNSQFHRGRQIKRNTQKSNINGGIYQYSLVKDNKYLIDNYSTVHDSELLRENPLSEYLIKSNILRKKRLLLTDIN